MLPATVDEGGASCAWAIDDGCSRAAATLRSFAPFPTISSGEDGLTKYPPGSPEAAFQEYYAAYEVGDLEAAYAYFSTGVKASMSMTAFRRSDSDFAWQRDQDRVDQTDGRAVLHLRVDEFSSEGLGGNRRSYERSMRLVEEGGAWLIDEAVIGIETGPFPVPAY